VDFELRPAGRHPPRRSQSSPTASSASTSRPSTRAASSHDRASWAAGSWACVVPEDTVGRPDCVSYALIVEELNRGDASVGITMWPTIAVHHHINLFASAAQKQQWLPRLAAARSWRLGPYRAGSGSDAAALLTRAEPATGAGAERQQAFITNASVSGVAVVMAAPIREEDERHLGLLVPKTLRVQHRTPYRKLGLHASDTPS